ncbi:MAG TPA: allantoicase [Pseudonocardiaceae bacterium]|jgi:allantoicase|nr:allantoicase [Pseudonocardiaceae bacterium]
MSHVDPDHLPDLASRRLGGAVLAASDEFFAEPENLIAAREPEFRPSTFTNKGQEYDGWETRRKRRDPVDHDWAIVRLGLPGIVHSVVVDTAFFTGNYPPFASVEGISVDGYPSPAELLDEDWEIVMPRSPLSGDSKNEFSVDSDRRYTHLRLRIYPDGGVARLRVYGTPVPDPRWLRDVPFDLAALANGGTVVRCSDWFYSPPNNMLQPGESLEMGDGWETARRRDGGHDWAVIRLAAPGLPTVLEIDTTHYKGNAPDQVSVSGINARHALDDDQAWRPLLGRTRLQPDTSHRFHVSVDEPVTHLRLDVFPDGGIARVRVFGRITDEGAERLHTAWLTSLPAAHTQKATESP